MRGGIQYRLGLRAFGDFWSQLSDAQKDLSDRIEPCGSEDDKVQDAREDLWDVRNGVIIHGVWR